MSLLSLMRGQSMARVLTSQKVGFRAAWLQDGYTLRSVENVAGNATQFLCSRFGAADVPLCPRKRRPVSRALFFSVPWLRERAASHQESASSITRGSVGDQSAGDAELLQGIAGKHPLGLGEPGG